MRMYEVTIILNLRHELNLSCLVYIPTYFVFYVSIFGIQGWGVLWSGGLVDVTYATHFYNPLHSLANLRCE